VVGSGCCYRILDSVGDYSRDYGASALEELMAGIGTHILRKQVALNLNLSKVSYHRTRPIWLFFGNVI